MILIHLNTRFFSASSILQSPTPLWVSFLIPFMTFMVSSGDSPFHLYRVYADIPVLCIPAAQCNKTFSSFSERCLNNFLRSFLSLFCILGFSRRGLLAPSNGMWRCFMPLALQPLATSWGCSETYWSVTIIVIPSNSLSIYIW